MSDEGKIEFCDVKPGMLVEVTRVDQGTKITGRVTQSNGPDHEIDKWFYALPVDTFRLLEPAPVEYPEGTIAQVAIGHGTDNPDTEHLCLRRAGRWYFGNDLVYEDGIKDVKPVRVVDADAIVLPADTLKKIDDYKSTTESDYVAGWNAGLVCIRGELQRLAAAVESRTGGETA